MNRLAHTTCALLLLLAAPAWGDEWPQPTVQERTSANGQVTVRVTPGESWGEVGGFIGRPKGRHATAEWYQSNNGAREATHAATLLNPIAPVDFLVTDSGILVTLDNWQNAGTDFVVAIYSPAGEIVRKYTLNDLYAFREIRRFGVAGTSILWRCYATSSTALRAPNELQIEDVLGGVLSIRLDTGALNYRREAGTCATQHLLPPQQAAAPITREPVAVGDVPARRWGEVTDGLQLAVQDVAPAQPTQDDSLIHVGVMMRNASDTEITLNSTLPSVGRNDFEYEIDGTWYAFEPAAPAPTPYSTRKLVLARSSAAVTDGNQTTSNGTVVGGMPSAWLLSTISSSLHVMSADGPGAGFVPAPGAHILRARPRRELLAGRQAPVSNPAIMVLKPFTVFEAGEQSVEFNPPDGRPLGGLRIASRPPDDRTLIRQVIARPPDPASVPLVVNSTALQVVGPLTYHELKLPYYTNAVNPPLPDAISRYRYVVNSGIEVAATIDIATGQDGLVLWSMEPASSSNMQAMFDALQFMGALERFRSGDYEPRLLQVTGERGMKPLLVMWLHSPSGKPDQFYLPRPNDAGVTKVASDRLYTRDDFLADARALPLTPQHDAAWAIATAAACAAAATSAELVPDRAEVETGLGEQQDRVIWYVHIPAVRPLGAISSPLPAASYQVDDMDGTCRPIERR